MPIQILPPQLANQIAAGEVVERPASVVKELVENSLDAGATRIDIDIERGGAKLIRIRDNGAGIGKAELALALARHATSKISTLDDLEAIVSLGFRGEALASISSVSRLTMTSRPEGQAEAWQAYAEGREMAVTVKPAAHPVGTTLEVLDLFYNTPARRKFLRTEKTEFAHIDEVVRRIALARFDITLTLQHNGKTVRQYRAVREGDARERRLGAICGTAFVQHALALAWRHDDLAIHGWVAAPQAIRQIGELQYCYVNGRMMRDRLITHAIRQAYQDRLSDELPPAYVLYLEIDPRQVDVNVHPAKHEVRFHQARLVHDFIYQAVVDVLQQAQVASAQDDPTLATPGAALDEGPRGVENRASAGENRFNRPASSPVASAPRPAHAAAPRMPAGDIFRRREGELYQRLLAASPTPAGETDSAFVAAPSAPPPAAEPPAVAVSTAAERAAPGDSLGRVLTLCADGVALTECRRGVALVSLSYARRCLLRAQLQPSDEGLKAQPLLVPLRLTLEAAERQALQAQQPLLQQMGIRLQPERQHAQLHAVPPPPRQQNLPRLIPQMLRYLATAPACDAASLADWLAVHWHSADEAPWTVAQAVQLLADLERLCPQLVQSPPRALLQPLNLQPGVERLRQEEQLNE
ncbi:DNA mismatch repair endonuclease MutL [Edwardsiella piscicida]|uniref:DNA mismatch repair endonuclease MutL n=1 Tax=Edwardsiella piscicida TaxID=1263550 RepID=UPI001CECD916|nr:DNA mismatch repair endonuclease MutL [Edwardsiella piscicida]AOP41836.2 DNA mismatch repair endonuclease MutL [Edwardsiella piscicida]